MATHQIESVARDFIHLWDGRQTAVLTDESETLPFQIGDYLHVLEKVPPTVEGRVHNGYLTGRMVAVRVSHVARAPALPPGYVMLSFDSADYYPKGQPRA